LKDHELTQALYNKKFTFNQNSIAGLSDEIEC